MSSSVSISIKQLPHHEGLPFPAHMSEGASGLDLVAAIENPLVLNTGQRVLIPTGICVAIPPGFEGQIRPRSGLAHRHGIGVLNSPGTIDSDYRGEIQVILINLGSEPFTIQRGDRIAQLVIASCLQASFKIADELDVTKRHGGGFGHTGVSLPPA